MPKKTENTDLAPKNDNTGNGEGEKKNDKTNVFSLENYKTDSLDNIKKLTSTFKDKEQFEQLFEKYNNMYISMNAHLKEFKECHSKILAVISFISDECVSKFNARAGNETVANKDDNGTDTTNNKKEVVAPVETPVKDSDKKKVVVKKVVKKKTEDNPEDNTEAKPASKKASKPASKKAQEKPETLDETPVAEKVAEKKVVKKPVAKKKEATPAGDKKEPVEGAKAETTDEANTETKKKTVKKVVKKVKKTE